MIFKNSQSLKNIHMYFFFLIIINIQWLYKENIFYKSINIYCKHFNKAIYHILIGLVFSS